MDEPLDSDVAFLLDAEEISDEEWLKRRKCRENRPGTRIRMLNGEYKYMPEVVCNAKLHWRIFTTFANAQKVETLYCWDHALMFHEGVRKWALIYHNTKADTQIINIETEEVCICKDGDECDSILEYRRLNPSEPFRKHEEAKPYWSN